MNIPTIITIFIVAVAIGFAVGRIIRNKKRGKSGCGGACSGCPYSSSCDKN